MQQNYSYVLKAKKIAADLKLRYDDKSIFYVDTELLSNVNVDIQNIVQNKKYFIDFITNVHNLLKMGT